MLVKGLREGALALVVILCPLLVVIEHLVDLAEVLELFCTTALVRVVDLREGLEAAGDGALVVSWATSQEFVKKKPS